MTDSESQSSPAPTVNWAIVIQSFDESYRLHRVDIPHIENGGQIWTGIQRQILSSSIARCLSTLLTRHFAKVVVGIGTVKEVHTTTPMHSSTSVPVSIHTSNQDWRLTAAFHDPAILADDTDHLANNKRFIIDPAIPTTKLGGREVIVIRKILDKTKITTFLIFLLIISPALGLAVGMCAHKAEVGIAVSAGIFALASFLQGLAAWFNV